MKFQLVLIGLLMLVACQPTKQTDVEKQPAMQAQPIDIVRGYYNKAEKLKLPLVWENTSNELPVNEHRIFRLKEEDTLLFGKGVRELTLLGIVPDTSKFFTFLFHYPGDNLRPYMITFDKKGKLIEEHMTGYNCGVDCGFYCIKGVFTLNKDLSFTSRHVSYQAECDDQQMNMDTTKVAYVVMERKGKILANGKFSEGEDKQVENREMPFNSPENPLNKIE